MRATSLVPTWAALAALLPSAPQPPAGELTLCREKNGWCIYSAQLWLALEYKGIPYTTKTVLASDAPQIQWADGSVQRDYKAIKRLDEMYPSTPPLWPPDNVDASTVETLISEFEAAVPRGVARDSSRAAFLFSKEEGFHYDTLPRHVFVDFLDVTESLLAKHGGDDGPFFCGACVSAADIVFAPLLERYAAQLPCLHAGLVPRGSEAWPLLSRWYDAMDQVPAYACRVKGDAQSWRKVLSTSPWWPAGWPSRGDPEERGDPRGGELALTEEDACVAFGGDGSVAPDIWNAYASGRAHVSIQPAAEAAAKIVRNSAAIVRDAEKQYALPAGTSADEYDAALRAVAASLLAFERIKGSEEAETSGSCERSSIRAFFAYLSERMCVPRDLGGPEAAAIRRASGEYADADGDATPGSNIARTVNKF